MSSTICGPATTSTSARSSSWVGASTAGYPTCAGAARSASGRAPEDAEAHDPRHEHRHVREPAGHLEHHEPTGERLDRRYVAEADARERREAHEQQLHPGAVLARTARAGEAAGLDRLAYDVRIGERPGQEGEGGPDREQLV